MRKSLKTLVLVIMILTIFAGCTNSQNSDSQYENNGVNNEIENTETKSSLSLVKGKPNQQSTAEIVLDREIPGTQYPLFDFSFTNGNECVDKLYVFNVDPDTIVENNSDTEVYENNYINKYTYSYLNGKRDSDIQVQRYSRDDITDEPWYCDQYFYIKCSNYKDKLQAYHSYEIGTNGSVFEGDYFYYSYNENGLLTNTMDDTGYENYFYYDEQGVLECRTFDVVESDYDEKTYSYVSEDGNIVTVYVYNPETGNTINRYEYEYNSDNCIINESVYSYVKNEEKRMKRTTSYSYDDNGNISKIIEDIYDNDTDSYITTSKSYFYNDNNNISRIVTDDGKSVKYTVFVYTDNPAEYINEN